MTKTPKLERARNIPEWTIYDEDVAELTNRLSGKSNVTTGEDARLQPDVMRMSSEQQGSPSSKESAHLLPKDEL